ncbi:Late transcription factor VLTF-4 (1), partial [Monkeypox virus]
KVATDNIVKDL